MRASINILIICLVTYFSYIRAQEKCEAAIDLTLIVDSSGSINAGDFEKSKQALIDIVGRLNVDVKQAGVAIINFASNVTLDGQSRVFEFDKKVLLNTIGALERIGSKTATGDALDLAKKYCQARCRPLAEGVPRIFVIFTDGHSNQGRPVIPAAQALRDTPIEGSIFAIGIGNIGKQGEKELIAIAGGQENVMKIASYLDLIRASNAIAMQMCDYPAFVEPDVETEVQVTANKTRYYRMHTLKKVAKNAFFEIELNDLEGQSMVYTSTSDRKPSSLTSKSITTRALGRNIYTTYVPANAKDFYFSVKSLKPTKSKAKFVVHVTPLDF